MASPPLLRFLIFQCERVGQNGLYSFLNGTTVPFFDLSKVFNGLASYDSI